MKHNQLLKARIEFIRYGLTQGLNYVEIGKIMGIKKAYVSQIVSKYQIHEYADEVKSKAVEKAEKRWEKFSTGVAK